LAALNSADSWKIESCELNLAHGILSENDFIRTSVLSGVCNGLQCVPNVRNLIRKHTERAQSWSEPPLADLAQRLQPELGGDAQAVEWIRPAIGRLVNPLACPGSCKTSSLLEPSVHGVQAIRLRFLCMRACFWRRISGICADEVKSFALSQVNRTDKRLKQLFERIQDFECSSKVNLCKFLNHARVSTVALVASGPEQVSRAALAVAVAKAGPELAVANSLPQPKGSKSDSGTPSLVSDTTGFLARVLLPDKATQNIKNDLQWYNSIAESLKTRKQHTSKLNFIQLWSELLADEQNVVLSAKMVDAVSDNVRQFREAPGTLRPPLRNVRSVSDVVASSSDEGTTASGPPSPAIQSDTLTSAQKATAAMTEPRSDASGKETNGSNRATGESSSRRRRRNKE
jgi:hypothetical protein